MYLWLITSYCMYAQRYIADETDTESWFVNITHLKSATNADNGVSATHESWNSDQLVLIYLPTKVSRTFHELSLIQGI